MTNIPKQSLNSSNASTHPDVNAHIPASRNEETDTPSPSKHPDTNNYRTTRPLRYVHANPPN
jgi:hypothetical protein